MFLIAAISLTAKTAYQEQEEKLVIASTNTIHHPNTVVIHLQNASST